MSSKKPLRDYEIGDEVTITAVVVRKSGQVLLWWPVEDGDRRWSIQGNVLAAPGGDEDSRALLQSAVRQHFGEVEEEGAVE